MKVDEVDRQLIAVAKEAFDDPEAASGRERRLFRDVFLYLANTATGEAAELSRATLRAWDLRFRRCA